MAGSVLHPEEVGSADAERVLTYVNGATDAAQLADTVGFSEGPEIGLQVANALLDHRLTEGSYATLGEMLGVTGISLARFTEIVVALSSARPAGTVAAMRLTPTSTRPWLGQNVGIEGQLLDTQGRGIAGANVSFFASSGVLTAPNERGEIQRGSSIRLITEPAGLVRMQLRPPFNPPLDNDERSALEAELAHLGGEEDSPAAVAPALAALADRYRAEGSSVLRHAIDRLFEAFPVGAAEPGSTWTIETMTVMAFAEGDRGQPVLAGATSLFFRNWLSAFLPALRAAIEGDTRLDDALAKMQEGPATADSARDMVIATQAFAGLERGLLGGRERDKIAGQSTNRFVEKLGTSLDANALADAVRVAGASNAAISAGGFKVFQAIQSVQKVSEADVTNQINTVATAQAGAIKTLRDDVLNQAKTEAADVVRNQIKSVETVQLGAIKNLREDLLRQTKAEVAQATNEVAAVRNQINTLENVQLKGLREELIAKTGEVAQFKVRIDSIEADRVATNRQFVDLQAQVRNKADVAMVNNLQFQATEVTAGKRGAGAAGIEAGQLGGFRQPRPK